MKNFPHEIFNGSQRYDLLVLLFETESLRKLFYRDTVNIVLLLLFFFLPKFYCNIMSIRNVNLCANLDKEPKPSFTKWTLFDVVSISSINDKVFIDSQCFRANLVTFQDQDQLVGARRSFVLRFISFHTHISATSAFVMLKQKL